MAPSPSWNTPSAVWNDDGRWFSAGTPQRVVTATCAQELVSLPHLVSQHLDAHADQVAVGIIAYDAGQWLHRIETTSLQHASAPVAVVHFHARADIIELDHLNDLDRLYPGPDQSTCSPAFSCDTGAATYRQHIDRIQAYLRAGDCYQVNYTRRFSALFNGNPYHAWRNLVAAHPAPHASFFAISPTHTVFGVSPERFLHVRDGSVTTEPIKGSRPRGQNHDEDVAYASALLQSNKDQSENLMIVDLLRNDLGKVCVTGSVKAKALFELRRFSNVQHLVSTITGSLREDVTPLEALLQCFPGGSITGAPKKRAMEIIAELEPHPRGYYCGSQFVLDARGNLDSSILIRTFQTDGDHIYCHGGGGIVIDSDPDQEYAESAFKVSALMQSL